MQVLWAPASNCILSGESIPGELLLSRAHFRFDSYTNFNTINYIYKLSKKATTFRLRINARRRLTPDDRWRNALSKLKGRGIKGITFNSWNGYTEGMVAVSTYEHGSTH